MSKGAKEAKKIEASSLNKEKSSSLLQDDESLKGSEKDKHHPKGKDSNPKLFILKILISNLPKSVVKGKLRNMENEYFEEYFGLLSSLIKISKDLFFVEIQESHEAKDQLEKEQTAEKKEFFDDKVGKFHSSEILSFCVEIVKLNH